MKININHKPDHTNKILPQLPLSNQYINDIALRDTFIKEGMYAFVSWKWTKPLSVFLKEKKCLEIMAGRGWLSLALRKFNIDIIATDDYSWHKKQQWDETVTNVEKINCLDAIKKYGKDIDYLILSWPPYQKNDAYRAIKLMYFVNPNAKIIYIGEDCGGCTADDEFFKHFEELYDSDFELVSSQFECWSYVHDRIMLGEFKK